MSEVNPEFMKYLDCFMPKPTQPLIESKVNKATAHLDAGLREVCQAMALLGQESIDNDAYSRLSGLLTYHWKGLVGVFFALRDDAEQAKEVQA